MRMSRFARCLAVLAVLAGCAGLSVAHADAYLKQIRHTEAAQMMHREPMSMQLRYLQTLTEIAVEKNSTIVFPVPIDWMKALMGPRAFGDASATPEKKA